MLRIIPVKEAKPITLSDYAEQADFAHAVADLRAEATLVAPRLVKRKIWMINSTDKGGGVAEMLPRMIVLMRELGFSVEWAVIGSDQPDFFKLTKRMHNLVHGDTRSGVDLTPNDARLYEAVNHTNAAELKRHLGKHDIVIVHDPQPLPLGRILDSGTKHRFIWRCHIGLDEHTDATRAVWRFMRPYVEPYRHAVFSAPEYIPGFLTGRASVIHPALDPLSHKNRLLQMHKAVSVLANSGLQKPHEPVPTSDFTRRVLRLCRDGSYKVPGEFGLLFRPIVLQISRWDRLKGWLPLMEGFIRMKERLGKGAGQNHKTRNRRRLELSRLVLVGPEPKAIQDDPEGVAVFKELRELYLKLDKRVQEDIVILALPMSSRKENALIVNALQHCASVVVQNSLREGFGLTVTEAMWKGMAVLGTHACGIRQQIRDGIDGRMVYDPEDPNEIAARLLELLVDPAQRHLLGIRARRRVHDSFLIFRQLAQYVRMLGEVA